MSELLDPDYATDELFKDYFLEKVHLAQTSENKGSDRFMKHL